MAIISGGHRGGAGRCEPRRVCLLSRSRGPEDPPLTRTTRWTTAAALAAVLTTAVGGAAAGSKGPTLQQLQARAAALRVQVNLAVAQDSAVKAEMARLSGLVTTEQSIVAADQSAADAADARVKDAQARVAQLSAEHAADHAALVNRAIDLYEHPYQYAQILLSGADSLQQLTDRQVLADAVQATTTDVIDAVRHDEIQERAAEQDLAAARAEAVQRHSTADAEYQRLQTALASQQRVHVVLAARINDDDAQLTALQPQISAQIAANTARYKAAIASVSARAQVASADPVLGPVGSYGLQWPISGLVTQEFGHNGHPGIDIAAAYGTPIHAAGTGVVIYASWESGYGNYTCISHGGGISTCYGHQSAIYVSVGQTVSRGQVIGAEGSTGNSTGPHVHFEVRVDGAVRNPRLFIPGNP
ncbi:MAG TPA: peptidoglycan DD-metalloendopeptidase family protein [Acidimicrobiales bacterium]|nr:peptidoglycan DD-metalloendopeptidase family protein [Acidimicrobiales bacterium]